MASNTTVTSPGFIGVAVAAILTVSTTLILGYSSRIQGNLIPRSDNGFDVGTSTSRWHNGYFAGQLSVGSCVGCGGGSSDTPWFTSGVNVQLTTSTNNVLMNTFSATTGTFLNAVSSTAVQVNGNASTSTVSLGTSSSGGCLKIEDSDKGGFTYLTTKSGSLTISTTPCN